MILLLHCASWTKIKILANCTTYSTTAEFAELSQSVISVDVCYVQRQLAF